LLILKDFHGWEPLEFCFIEDSFSVIRSVEKATLPWKGELDQIPKAAWKLATRRQRIIAPLAELDHVTESEVEQAGKALRLSMRTVFRLIAYYRRKPCTSVLAPERAGANAQPKPRPESRENH
jgi:hypothetical protein